MSACFTVRAGAVTKGIPASVHGKCVRVGADYTHADSRMTDEPRLVQRSVTVAFDATRPPIIEASGLILEASLTTRDHTPYLTAARPNENGILVYLDTALIEPCETGGHWEVLGGKTRELARGRDGFREYTVRHRGGMFGDPLRSVEPTEEVDESTCYDIGLLLMFPGDRLQVEFHVPGTFVAELDYGTDGLRIHTICKEIDEDYEYERPEYQAEQDLSEDLGRERMLAGDDWD